MYQTLTFYHNLVRWLVLASLLYAIARAYRGYVSKTAFTKTDNTVRHLTATICHIQLMIGMLFYFKSPVIRYFFANVDEAILNIDVVFFALIHSILMLTAIVLVTIGSAIVKRKQTDHAKFRTMLIWFSLALVIIFMAVPWPFSPLVNRPYYR